MGCAMSGLSVVWVCSWEDEPWDECSSDPFFAEDYGSHLARVTSDADTWKAYRNAVDTAYALQKQLAKTMREPTDEERAEFLMWCQEKSR